MKSLLKEKTYVDLNKLLYLENSWKLKFDIEKCKSEHIGYKNIRVEYELTHKGIKKSK